MTYLLGIDAGATKTQFVLADGDGKTLAKTQVGPSNLHDISLAHIAEMFSSALKVVSLEATGKSRVAIDAVVAGWAGLDSLPDQQAAHDIMDLAFNHALPKPRRVRIVNDTIIGLWSGSMGENALCVIGGTGSNGYGRNAKNDEAWAGGLGHLLADEGSGYQIGLNILHAAVQSSDGRIPKTMLESLVLKKFGVKNMRDLVPIVYNHGFGKYEIGQLAFLLEPAEKKRDVAAMAIAKNAASDLFAIANAVAKQLGFRKSTAFDLVTIGGVLKHDAVISKTFRALVKEAYPEATIIVPKEEPVAGAIRMARHLMRL